MGEAPPLDELAARKRLVQAKLDLHRAEMALYYRHLTAPFQIVQKGTSFLRHPTARLIAVGLAGWLLFSGRFSLFQKTTGLIVPIVLPRLRGMLANQAVSFFLKGFQLFR